MVVGRRDWEFLDLTNMVRSYLQSLDRAPTILIVVGLFAFSLSTGAVIWQHNRYRHVGLVEKSAVCVCLFVFNFYFLSFGVFLFVCVLV